MSKERAEIKIRGLEGETIPSSRLQTTVEGDQTKREITCESRTRRKLTRIENHVQQDKSDARLE